MNTTISLLAEPFELKGENTIDLLIILIHGFTASPTEVRPLGEYLFTKSNQKFLIKSILLPGHGIDGPDGYKALDSITYYAWKKYVLTTIDFYSSNYQCPVIIIGLSMGALLTIQFLDSKIGKKEKFIAAILLSPALVIKNRFFYLIKYLKYIKKYQYKGRDSGQFFKEYNLFSYTTRSLHAVDEFRKLMNETKPMVKHISKPMLAYLAYNDDLVNIKKTNELLQQNIFIKTSLIKNMGHIFTVYPESEKIFEEIFLWINKLLEQTKKKLNSR